MNKTYFYVKDGEVRQTPEKTLRKNLEEFVYQRKEKNEDPT